MDMSDSRPNWPRGPIRWKMCDFCVKHKTINESKTIKQKKSDNIFWFKKNISDKKNKTRKVLWHEPIMQFWCPSRFRILKIIKQKLCKKTRNSDLCLKLTITILGTNRTKQICKLWLLDAVKIFNHCKKCKFTRNVYPLISILHGQCSCIHYKFHVWMEEKEDYEEKEEKED